MITDYEATKYEELGITKEQAEVEEKEIKPLTYRKFCCIKREYPSLDELDVKIAAVRKAIEHEEEHFDVTSKIDLYFGTCFVVFSKQSDMVRAISHFESSLLW